MNSIQHEQLFTDLNPEQAEKVTAGGTRVTAAAQGGAPAALRLYKDTNGGRLGLFNVQGPKQMSFRADDQVSALIINRGTWRFFNLPNWDARGGYKDLGPGRYDLTKLSFNGDGNTMNDRISSFQKIA